MAKNPEKKNTQMVGLGVFLLYSVKLSILPIAVSVLAVSSFAVGFFCCWLMMW